MMQPLLNAPGAKTKEKKKKDGEKDGMGVDPELEKQMEHKAKHILKLQTKIETNTDAIDQIKGGPKKKPLEGKEPDINKRVIAQLMNPVKKKKKKVLPTGCFCEVIIIFS